MFYSLPVKHPGPCQQTADSEKDHPRSSHKPTEKHQLHCNLRNKLALIYCSLPNPADVSTDLRLFQYIILMNNIIDDN